MATSTVIKRCKCIGVYRTGVYSVSALVAVSTVIRRLKGVATESGGLLTREPVKVLFSLFTQGF